MNVQRYELRLRGENEWRLMVPGYSMPISVKQVNESLFVYFAVEGVGNDIQVTIKAISVNGGANEPKASLATDWCLGMIETKDGEKIIFAEVTGFDQESNQSEPKR